MSLARFHEYFSKFTRHVVAHQRPDGTVPDMPVAAYGILPLALSYSIEAPDNPWRGDERVLESILRINDANTRSFDLENGYQRGDRPNGDMGMQPFDDWRTCAWIEAVQLLGDRIDERRLTDAKVRWRAWAERLYSHCSDMDTFDGQIPNLGIWAHTIMYRIGRLVDEPRLHEMAQHALGRVIQAQSPDGAWREGQSAGLFKGTPVTNYALVSASAINLYHGWSDDPRAAAALERAWHWYYDFLMPNGASPPNLTVRQPYHPHVNPTPAWFTNKPEGRWLANKMLSHALSQDQDKTWGPARGIFFIAAQYAFLKADVEPIEPRWPQFKRMVGEEVGVRRRHKWHAWLTGMQNTGLSSFAMRSCVNERQDALALYHEDAGLVIGSAHSKLHEEASTFAFYETGRCHYLHDEAYLKATDTLDTLLLRYGSNLGAASIDTHDPQQARIIFSIHGERGRITEPGPGFPLSAMAAKAHLTLRVEPGDVVTIDGQTFHAAEPNRQQWRIPIGADQWVEFNRWRICCDCPWEFHWPVRLAHHYKLHSPGEWVAIAQVLLHPGGGTFSNRNFANAQPTAEFHVKVD